MSEDARLSKVSILIRQKKYAEAERMLRNLLAEDPNDIYTLTLLAETHLQQDQFEAARQVIDNAIGLSPASPHLYYVKTRLALMQDRYGEAELAVQQAIALNPYDADYFAMAANIRLLRKQFAEGLELADRALEIDPENVMALNTRSRALLKLGRADESAVTIEGALREDPNNAHTHANYGWNLLEKGDHKKALEHFREALKNDPNLDYAQAGMVQALKAANPIYRLFLRYSFWMGNLTAKYQWGVIIGFYIALRVLRVIADNNPSIQPLLTPLIVLLVLVAFSTWIITPMSNLFLRFNRYGQFLLDRNEKISSNFVGGSFLLFAVGVVLYLLLNGDGFLAMAVYGFGMMLPFGMMFTPSKRRNLFLGYAIGMAVVGGAAVALTFTTGNLMNAMSIIFLVGFMAFQWLANFFMIREDNR